VNGIPPLRSDPLPRPSIRRAEVDQDLDDIVSQSIAPNPEARFLNGEAMRAALTEYLGTVARLTDWTTVQRFVRSLFEEEIAASRDERKRLLELAAAVKEGEQEAVAGEHAPAPVQPSPTERVEKPLPARRRAVVGISIALALCGVAWFTFSGRAHRSVESVERVAPATSPPGAPAEPTITPDVKESPQAAALRPETPPVAPPIPPPHVAAGRSPKPRELVRPPTAPSQHSVETLLTEAHEAFGNDDLDVALRDAKRAADAGGGAEAHVIIGSVYAKRGNYREAEEAFAEAVRLDPTDATARRRLDRIRALLGKGSRPNVVPPAAQGQ
jgi:tetratricopeptide (TPR) repeat protein